MRIATARCGRLGAECRGSLRPDSVSRGRHGRYGEGGGCGKTWTGQARQARKVGVRRGLDLPEDALAASRRILETNGNMSSGTVLWVLRELLQAGTTGTIAGLAFGPGLVGEGLLLEV